ncbi:1-phosphatidylinositol 4,5-bisphosphate phosphodiesterase delta-4 isoform X2 [Callorhinchus milii]|uniref:1-phosphatidylinositol 4,5-bisphosphate phosphodiesterase delta-4 isoform X2 n=1 Tax=Callorhinchus milii TaxID=7868 RepID=UPI001C3FF25C|nr:1-phosphatidylinositol 4,5-bisphosphate phosphodiesterase delta-4 isoform X2 [Callorhinchus milii]XP_007908511.2 1-phosphatidylinositol 4,5-bisphosphate phosphodiesterase delta-4 isoform X2 [Callorhinchus milii]XP_007908512.2 1-phosphatidylinositol 4,5-bisphosphate phosphodiesterase delta-4 isoform X2 [Callorhinchus milii]
MATARPNLCLQDDRDVQAMQRGAVLRKVKSRSWKRPRCYRLQEDCMSVWYNSKKAGNPRTAFSLCDVEMVREGHQSELLQSLAGEFSPGLCFTIVFRGRSGNLDLVAESVQEAESWVRGLRTLINSLQNMDQKEKLDRWIRDWFQKADKDKDGRMNFKEVRDLLKMMNVNMNELHALSLFEEMEHSRRRPPVAAVRSCSIEEHGSCSMCMADKSRSGTLEGEEFVLFYKALTEREDLRKIFSHCSADGQTFSQREFAEFLTEQQLEPADTAMETASALIDRHEPSDTAKQLPALTLNGFLAYLRSPEGSIFNPEHERLHQDMSRPLNHYFINSSHNTYLLEDQLRGHSSVEGYIRALMRGCRCVEVDCWDGAGLEPVVYHGHTFTSKIFFKDVISVISKYAFTVSELPLILSIENHCSLEQQRVLAHHMRHFLGDWLVMGTIDGSVPTRMPSPEELRGKILVKGKRIGPLLDALSGPEEDPCSGEVTDEDEAAEAEDENIRNEVKRKEKVSKQSLAKELSDCVVYCKSVHFHSFHHSRQHYHCYELSSFTESKARKLIREAASEFVCHNTWQLSRVYPSGFRTDSSNFSPQEMWNAGCQIVALNFQTAGEHMDLNDGLFSQNGRCGFVLKPWFMRTSVTTFDPEHPTGTTGFRPITLTIQIISGQQLPKVANSKQGSIVDPLVRVEIHGTPGDCARQETKYIDNNGFNPVWYETLTFSIQVPELALIRFVVEDYDMTSKNDFVGQFTMPLSCVQQGYRHIHLLSRDGTYIPPSALFVHIRITED